MDMLNRYLAEIHRHLPRPQSDDIIAEIRDDLESQIEEGRDEESVIRAYGNPRVVAGRYAKMQYLIGPDLLPYYWYVLRLALIVILGLELFGAAAGAIVTGNAAVFLVGLAALKSSPLWIIGIVTLIFGLFQYFGNSTLLTKLRIDQWDPRKLPPVDGAGRVSRPKSAFEFFANFVMLLVLLNVAGSRTGLFVFTFGHDVLTSSPLALTSAWQPLYTAWVASCAVVALGAFIVYVRPTLVPMRYLAQTIGNTLVVAGAGMSLHSGDLLVRTSNTVSAADAAAINVILEVSLITIAVGAGIAAAFSLWKLIRPLVAPARAHALL